MKKIKTNLKSILIMLALGLIAFSACKKEDDPPEPQLPPEETMVIDFSDFSGGSTKSGLVDSTFADSTMINFNHAAGNIGFWNIMLTVTLVVPVASYHAGLLQHPEYKGDNVWEWNYDYNALFSTYTARLVGTVNSDESLKWEMYISNSGIGGFDEVLWYYGETAADGNSGQWILNKRIELDNSVVPVLQMDWVKEGDEVGSVKYTSIEEGIDFKDSYLIYGVQTGEYNAYYNIHAWWLTKFVDTDIEWNLDTKEGHVKDENKFGDTEWHCWDEGGYDGTCSK